MRRFPLKIIFAFDFLTYFEPFAENRFYNETNLKEVDLRFCCSLLSVRGRNPVPSIQLRLEEILGSCSCITGSNFLGLLPREEFTFPNGRTRSYKECADRPTECVRTPTGA